MRKRIRLISFPVAGVCDTPFLSFTLETSFSTGTRAFISENLKGTILDSYASVSSLDLINLFSLLEPSSRLSSGISSFDHSPDHPRRHVKETFSVLIDVGKVILFAAENGNNGLLVHLSSIRVQTEEDNCQAQATEETVWIDLPDITISEAPCPWSPTPTTCLLSTFLLDEPNHSAHNIFGTCTIRLRMEIQRLPDMSRVIFSPSVCPAPCFTITDQQCHMLAGLLRSFRYIYICLIVTRFLFTYWTFFHSIKKVATSEANKVESTGDLSRRRLQQEFGKGLFLSVSLSELVLCMVAKEPLQLGDLPGTYHHTTY